MRHLASCLLALVAACGVDLADTRAALVLCATDADCPTGLCSAAGSCVQERDTTLLRLEAALATSVSTVELRFDDAVGDVGTPENFTVGPGLSVIAAERGNDATLVVLTTSVQSFGQIYEVTVAGLADEQANPLAADATRANFVSFLGLPSSTPPTFLAPTAGSTLRAATVRFAWTGMPGATSYSLDVASDAAFTQDVQHFDTAALEQIVELPRDITYWARVRADGTGTSTYGTVTFDRVNDVVYVRCASAPCVGVGSGSRSAPLRSIAAALALARVTGRTEVRVASRPLGQPYVENVVITGRGVRLRGGFAETFANETPDPVMYPTTIQSINTVVEVSDILVGAGDVLIEGLDIVAKGPAPRGLYVRQTNTVTYQGGGIVATDGALQANEVFGIQMQDRQGAQTTKLVVRDASVKSGRATRVSNAIDIEGGTFELHDTQFTAQTAARASAIAAQKYLDAEIDACTFETYGPQSGNTAVTSTGHSAYIHDSTFRVVNQDVGDKGRALTIGDGSFLVERTVFEIRNLLFERAGVALDINGNGPVVVRNSSLVARFGDYALKTSGGSIATTPFIADSVLINVDGPVIATTAPGWSVANSYLVGGVCVTEGPLAFAASFVGNALACTGLYAPYHSPPVATITDINDVNALNGASYCAGSCPSNRRVSGNIAVGTGTSAFAGFATNDFHLTSTGRAALCSNAVDATSALCGSLAASPIVCGGDGDDIDSQSRAVGNCIGLDR